MLSLVYNLLLCLEKGMTDKLNFLLLFVRVETFSNKIALKKYFVLIYHIIAKFHHSNANYFPFPWKKQKINKNNTIKKFYPNQH